MRVLGTRQRGLPSEPPFNHTTGAGYVKATPLPGCKGAADYADAIVNRKARVHLLAHETSGAFSAYAARRLRRLGRVARALGIDGTDYATSYTASSFVSYYCNARSASRPRASSTGRAASSRRWARRRPNLQKT